MDDFERELKLGFLDEAAQAIDETEQCFLNLESGEDQTENLNKIFRLAHNLKGSSKAVGFSQFGEFTHEFESFILKVKNKQLPTNKVIVSLLLEGNDYLSEMVEKLKYDLDLVFEFDELLNKIKNPQVNQTDNTIEEEVKSAELQPSNVELKVEAEAHHKSELEVPQEIVQDNKFDDSTNKKISKPKSSQANQDESIRVSISKLEKLVNFVGEMVILQSVLKEMANHSRTPNLLKTVHELEKVGKEIQEISMGLRLVPIKPVFQKMSRIVRDTALALNKNVELVLKGEETELDKTILEKINDPLTHLVRNAVDHGVESKEKRESSEKPEKGTVQLSAFNRSGRLIIEVTDDGGGLNPEILIQKAIQKGVLKEGTKLTSKEAFNLVFAPGFSTKEVVTDVSGRGVGMDVVKTNIQDLGGEVIIESQLGKGTTFQISLPLTLAIMDAMTVSYSGHKFIIPLSHVHETVPTKDHPVQNTHMMGDILLLRGENLKLIRLGDLFGIKSDKPFEQMITMVIRTGSQPFALLVDDIIGQGQVVTKELSPELRGILGVSGSTILGDGKPALILEPPEFLKRKINNLYTPAKTTETARVA
ncbi:MAG: chemotaxis protein CheA [Bdellovibrionales bacterium]